MKLACGLYTSTGSPLPVLKAFLEIFSSGETNAGAVGSFKDADFDQRKAWLVTNIKGTMRSPPPPNVLTSRQTSFACLAQR